MVVTTYGLGIGTLMLLAWGAGAVWDAAGGWGVGEGVAGAGGEWCVVYGDDDVLLWNWGMTQVPASQAGVLLNMEPLIGSLLGVLVLGERLGPSAWVGGGLILASAITLTTRSTTRVRETMPLT